MDILEDPKSFSEKSLDPQKRITFNEDRHGEIIKSKLYIFVIF